MREGDCMLIKVIIPAAHWSDVRVRVRIGVRDTVKVRVKVRIVGPIDRRTNDMAPFSVGVCL